MKNNIELINVNCCNCDHEFESLFNINTGDYSENFCSEDCAMEWYGHRRMLELRKKKINKIRNGKC